MVERAHNIEYEFYSYLLSNVRKSFMYGVRPSDILTMPLGILNSIFDTHDRMEDSGASADLSILGSLLGGLVGKGKPNDPLSKFANKSTTTIRKE